MQAVGLLPTAAETLVVVSLRAARRERARRGAAPARRRRREGSELRKYHSQPQTLPAQSARSSHRAKLDFMQLSASPYEERLTAPRSWWAISFLVGVALALVFLPFGTLPMLGALVGGTAVAAVAASAYGSIRIRVVGGASDRRRGADSGHGPRPGGGPGRGGGARLAHPQGRHPRLHAAALPTFRRPCAWRSRTRRTRRRTCICRPGSRSAWRPRSTRHARASSAADRGGGPEGSQGPVRCVARRSVSRVADRLGWCDHAARSRCRASRAGAPSGRSTGPLRDGAGAADERASAAERRARGDRVPPMSHGGGPGPPVQGGGHGALGARAPLLSAPVPGISPIRSGSAGSSSGGSCASSSQGTCISAGPCGCGPRPAWCRGGSSPLRPPRRP